MSRPPAEPTEAPNERQGVEEFLDYYRAVLRRKVEGTWFVEDIVGEELSGSRRQPGPTPRPACQSM
ncbi:MAG: hypothetical protein L0L93_12130 [Brevibacterium sp.]|nr:hypothetical protein [Brevibacterium sp.]